MAATHQFSGKQNTLTAAVLFLATAAFVLWQNLHVAVLWDLSYLLDISWRIAVGQVPYRDFPLVHPPLTFLLQATIQHLTGRHYWLVIAYAALTGGAATVLTWRILFRILHGRVAEAWTMSLLLAAPLCVLGVYSIYPHPIYDCDCAVAILFALFLLQRLPVAEDSPNGSFRRWSLILFAGSAIVLPLFFKQNMGLPFLFSVIAGILLLLLTAAIGKQANSASSGEPKSVTLLKLLAAIALSLIAAILLLQITAGLNNYLQWTVHFAAQRRLPGLADMLSVYQQPSFAWTIPTLGLGLILLRSRLAARLWVRILSLALASAPFVGSLIYLFLSDDLDDRADNLLALWPLLLLASAAFALAELRKGITLHRLLPFFVLAAIHGTFLSQQLWGSTYAIWPLLIILIAYILNALPAAWPGTTITFASVISATFLICGSLYAIGHERLNYIQIPDEALYRSALPPLRGMADRGPFLPDFEELVQFAEKEIPPQDGILLLPGEEPFYYATGRTPQFPIQIFDQTTDPYSAAELMQQVRQRNIRWIIVKTRLQSNQNPLPDLANTLTSVARDFALYRKLNGYDVYRLR